MRVLVTGAAGIVGHYLLCTAPPDVKLWVTYRSRRPSELGVAEEAIGVDLTDELSTQALVTRIKPDIVVNAAGLNSVDECERNGGLCRLMNVEVTRVLVEAIASSGAHLVQLSTNSVYAGTQAPYYPEAERSPVNAYGVAKRDSENILFDRLESSRWMIVRLSPLFGWSPSSSRVNPLPWMHDTLAAGGRLDLCDDRFDSPLAADRAAAVIWTLIATGAHGMFNVGGLETVSRYGLGIAIARAFELDSGLIRPVGSDHFGAIAPRPLDSSLADPILQERFGLAPEPLWLGMARMRGQALGTHRGVRGTSRLHPFRWVSSANDHANVISRAL